MEVNSMITNLAYESAALDELASREFCAQAPSISYIFFKVHHGIPGTPATFDHLAQGGAAEAALVVGGEPGTNPTPQKRHGQLSRLSG